MATKFRDRATMGLSGKWFMGVDLGWESDRCAAAMVRCHRDAAGKIVIDEVRPIEVPRESL